MAWGAIYYVDCNADGDAGTGLTTASDVAWKTIAKVNASSFSAGDSVLFNKGCTWREQLTVPSPGSADNVITFGAYGSGAKPIMDGSDVIAGAWSTEAGAAESWEVVKEYVVDAAWTDHATRNYRQAVPADSAVSSGTKVRVSWKAEASNNAVVTNAVIGPMTSIGDFDSTPTQITVSGGYPATISAGATLLSDEIPFTYTKTQRYGIHTYTTDRDFQYIGAGNTTYYNSTGSDTSGDLTGPTSSYALSGPVFKIEIYHPAVDTIYYIEPGFTPAQIFRDGFRLTLAASKTAMLTGQWFWDTGTSRVYVYDNPAGFTTWEFSNRAYGIYINVKDYITVQDITVQKANVDGIRFASPTTHNTVTGVTSTYNYGNGIRSVWDSGTNGSTYISVTNNTVSYNGSNGIYSHRFGTNWTVSNNTVTNNCSIDTTSPAGTAGIHFFQMPDLTVLDAHHLIEHNIVSNNIAPAGAGGLYGNGIWHDTAGDSAIVRFNNVFANSSDGIVFEKSSFASIYYNIITGPISTYAYPRGIAIKAGDGRVDVANSNTVYNNTVTGFFWGSYLGLTGDGIGSVLLGDNLWKNNIFYGNTRNVGVLTTGANDETNSSGNVWTKNALGPDATNLYQWGDSTFYSTLEDWETASSQSGNISGDPLFVNAALKDFRLKTGSPAIDAGVDVGLTSDFNGMTKVGANWDIGAIEYYYAQVQGTGTGVLGAAAASPCPTGTYLGWWNGDYPSQAGYICTSNGASYIDATVSGATVNSTSITCADTQYVAWAGLPVSGTTGTIFLSFYVTDEGNTDIDNDAIIDFRVDTNNFIYCAIDDTTNKVKCYHRGNSGTQVDVLFSGAVTYGGWYRMGYSWSNAEGKHAIFVQSGEGAIANWTSAVEETETINAWASEPTYFGICDRAAGGVIQDTSIAIKDIIVTAGYKDADQLP